MANAARPDGAPHGNPASGPWRLVTVSAPGDGQEPGRSIRVPAIERDSLDDEWLRNLPPAIPDEVLQALARTGHEVQQRRELVPVPLRDGRRLVVPVNQVEVHYTGSPAYSDASHNFFIEERAMLKSFPIAAAALAILSVGEAVAQYDDPTFDDRPWNVLLASEPMRMGQYWLGVQCLPVMPALRAQLNLPEKQGLLVAAVVPDSPAAKAHIKLHDILMRAGEKPLTEVRDLLQAIEAAKGAKLKIDLIRGGKPRTLEATPAMRPKVAGQTVLPPPESADWNTIQNWMESMVGHEEGQAERPPMRFRFIGPTGVIVPKDAAVPRPLPPGMSVVISKEGDKPAKISVKRGDKKWEVTEKQLDGLPADVRPFVEQMLGRGAISVFGGLNALDVTPDTVPHQPLPAPGSLDERIQKRLDEMDRRIERLLRAVEELRTGHGQQAPPDSHQEK